jgi:hypothetical protein
MTLGEVAPLDLDAVARGQYAGIADQFTADLQTIFIFLTGPSYQRESDSGGRSVP